MVDVIENIFKVTVERDVEAERKILEALPREQIVETLLRTHVSTYFAALFLSSIDLLTYLIST